MGYLKQFTRLVFLVMPECVLDARWNVASRIPPETSVVEYGEKL